MLLECFSPTHCPYRCRLRCGIEAYVLAAGPETSELVRQCLGHWVFEHIHPVHDGNGRIGRLLHPVTLKRKGFTTTPCAYVSEGVYRDKQLYVDALKHARVSGDMLPWTRLMLGFMDRGARANLIRLDRLLNLKARCVQATSIVRSDSVIHKLVPFALTPAFTIRDAVDEIKETFASVDQAAGWLTRMRILTLAHGVRRDRLFQGDFIVHAYERRAKTQRVSPS